MNNLNQENLNQEFLTDYEKIVSFGENTSIIQREWLQNGDFFQKLSIYDDSYTLIRSAGNTTLLTTII